MQSSRKPRRSFAAPLVITAALPACIISSKPAPAPTTVNTHDHRTDDGTGTGTGSGGNLSAQHNPPMPSQGPAPDYQRNWNVTVNADGKCQAQVVVDCKRGATCNPPMPVEISCPAGIAEGDTIHVYAQPKSWDCYAEPNVQCPAPPATCNPPPPQQTACPGE